MSPNRAYMAGLKSSVMSLYEVGAIVPGRSLLARDLIRGGDPVLVSERTATQMLAPWDQIAARIVSVPGKRILRRRPAPFTARASQLLVEMLREGAPHAFKGRRKPKLSAAGLVGWIGGDDDLRDAAPSFTSAWLLDVVARLLDPKTPKMFNTDGDEIVFHTVRFPVPKGARKEVALRLNAIPTLDAGSAALWSWLDTAVPGRQSDADAQVWSTTNQDGYTVLGSVQLKGGALTLEVNSASRAERGRDLLAGVVGDLVGPPLTAIQTVEQMMESRPAAGPPPPDPHIENPEALIHEMLGAPLPREASICRSQLCTACNLSPRAAAADPRRHPELVEWLKTLERRSRSEHDRSDPLATYDFFWMWRELGVEHLRR